jgi:hypothetical protein
LIDINQERQIADQWLEPNVASGCGPRNARGVGHPPGGPHRRSGSGSQHRKERWRAVGFDPADLLEAEPQVERQIGRIGGFQAGRQAIGIALFQPLGQQRPSG